jgi:hypothetical protein
LFTLPELCMKKYHSNESIGNVQKINYALGLHFDRSLLLKIVEQRTNEIHIAVLSKIVSQINRSSSGEADWLGSYFIYESKY